VGLTTQHAQVSFRAPTGTAVPALAVGGNNQRLACRSARPLFILVRGRTDKPQERGDTL
jgi:hypothetical protein